MHRHIKYVLAKYKLLKKLIPDLKKSNGKAFFLNLAYGSSYKHFGLKIYKFLCCRFFFITTGNGTILLD